MDLVAADVMCLNKNSTQENDWAYRTQVQLFCIFMSASIRKTTTEMIYFLFYRAPTMRENTSLKTCTVHCAHCIIMYLYKELYSSTFCCSLQGELNHTASCWSAILEWGEPARALQVWGMQHLCEVWAERLLLNTRAQITKTSLGR